MRMGLPSVSIGTRDRPMRFDDRASRLERAHSVEGVAEVRTATRRAGANEIPRPGLKGREEL